jgi:hypothetical protein
MLVSAMRRIAGVGLAAALAVLLLGPAVTAPVYAQEAQPGIVRNINIGDVLNIPGVLPSVLGTVVNALPTILNGNRGYAYPGYGYPQGGYYPGYPGGYGYPQGGYSYPSYPQGGYGYPPAGYGYPQGGYGYPQGGYGYPQGGYMPPTVPNGAYVPRTYPSGGYVPRASQRSSDNDGDEDDYYGF